MFGDDRMLNAVGYAEQNWMGEEYSEGCYVGVMPPGVMSSLGEELGWFATVIFRSIFHVVVGEWLIVSSSSVMRYFSVFLYIFSRLAAASRLGPGDTIRDPIGRIHFAGTETATLWSGYMDGAISAGIFG